MVGHVVAKAHDPRLVTTGSNTERTQVIFLARAQLRVLVTFGPNPLPGADASAQTTTMAFWCLSGYRRHTRVLECVRSTRHETWFVTRSTKQIPTLVPVCSDADTNVATKYPVDKLVLSSIGTCISKLPASKPRRRRHAALRHVLILSRRTLKTEQYELHLTHWAHTAMLATSRRLTLFH